MDFFFHRHFGRRGKIPNHPAGPAVPTSKARRRSSVGLPSVALVQSRRSSLGLPPVCTDGRRRASVGILVASGQKRHSFVEMGLPNTSEPGSGFHLASDRGTRAFHYKLRRARHASGTIPCVQRGLAVRYRRTSKVKSIEPHLLGSSMLLASVVQMGREIKDKEDKEYSCSESDGEEGSDAEVENKTGEINNANFRPTSQMHLTQAIVMENIKLRPLLRPPRCLRRNSSHLLPAESVLQSSEMSCGVYGRYNQQSSNEAQWTKPIQTSVTSPSLGQATLAVLGYAASAETDLASSGSALHKSFSSPPGGPEGTIYYDPYLDTWDNFLLYVTPAHTQKHIDLC